MKAKKLYQRIARAIANDISDGRYAIGARLPGERELAEAYGVSRPTVREAMIALEIQGLVEARHGSGLYVTAVPEDSAVEPELDVGAFELLEARILFEGEVAAVAAAAIEPAQLAKLDEILAQMEACDASSPEALEADHQFHALIAEATGNSVIGSVFDLIWNLRERSPLSAYMFAEARREGVHPRVEEHRTIVEALRKGSPTQARKSMREHLQRVVSDLLAATEIEVMERARSEIEMQRERLAKRMSL